MKTHLSLFVLLAAFVSLQAQTGYKQKTFTGSTGTTLNYRELKPANPDSNQTYPLVLFMHGAGERGSDNTKQLLHGSRMFENPVNQEKYPAFVLFPQCPENEFWAYPERPASLSPDGMPVFEKPTPLIQTVAELVSNYLNMPEVDKNRVYVIGMSMGGMATYDLASRYPEIFAAAIPICGTVNPNRLQTIKDVKFRIYHGDADDIVPVEGSRQAYKSLKSTGNEVEYFEFPGINHNSWTPAFNQPDFMDWLFSQSKNKEENNINLD